MSETIDHPSHYADIHSFECIELTREFNFIPGNMFKYVFRHDAKGKPVEDLKKAQWYCNHLSDSDVKQIKDIRGQLIVLFATLINETTGLEQQFWRCALNGSIRGMKRNLKNMIKEAEQHGIESD